MLNYRMILIVMLLVLTQSAVSQKAPDREWVIFNKGIQDYQNKQFDKAAENFETVIARLKTSKLITANYFMLTKTLYKQQKYQASLDTCRRFTDMFSRSEFVDDIHFLEANLYYRLKRYQTAAKTWLHVAEKSSDSRLRIKSFDLGEKVLRYRLDLQDLIYLKKENNTGLARQAALYHLAERYYNDGNHSAALAALNDMKTESISNPELEQKAQRLNNFLNHKKKKMVRIAALLPLSGSNSEIGNAMMYGLRLAVDDFNGRHGALVEVVPFDYKTNLTDAVQKLKEIAADGSISAVFGPLENDVASACAAIAGYENISLITPTATESELCRISASTVQLSIPQNFTARKLARFALDTLNLRRFATISPNDDYFVKLTKFFIEHVKDGGGEIISEQWYSSDDQNITNYIKSIKRAGLRQTFSDSVMQSDSTVSLDQIDSIYAEYMKTEIERLEETHSKIDSADIAVKSIDAIFAPIYKEDISLIASQFAYWNIQAQMLGNGDWYDKQILKKNKSYLNNLIFFSDGYLNEESWDYKKFTNDFWTAFKLHPKKFEIIGFDCFNFVLSAIDGKSASEISRDNFLQLLKQAPVYNGIYMTFSVGEKRYNNSMRMQKYSYGQIIPLK